MLVYAKYRDGTKRDNNTVNNLQPPTCAKFSAKICYECYSVCKVTHTDFLAAFFRLHPKTIRATLFDADSNLIFEVPQSSSVYCADPAPELNIIFWLRETAA